MQNSKKIILWLLPVMVAIFSLGVGRFDVEVVHVLKIIASQIIPIEPTWTEMEETVVMNIRLPRILLALLIGGGLAIAGASFKGCLVIH